MIVIVGPSGSGKTAIAEKLAGMGYKLSISYTTRKPRKGEVNGVHYHFVSKDEFREKIMQGFFVEWATVGDDLYGTSKDDAIDNIIKIVEPNGLRQLMSKCKTLVVYIKTPDKVRTLRMVERGDDEDSIAKRIIIDGAIFTPEVEKLAQVVYENYEPITQQRIEKLHEVIQVCQNVMSKHKIIPTVQI
jgi:guanylate kinase